MNLSQLPNAITIIRILLVVPVVYCLGQGLYAWALYLFLAAGVSDALDGLLARQFHWRSRFGAIADPLADKLLMVASFFALSALGHLPWWLFLLVLFRDFVIVVGGLVYHRIIGPFKMQPSIFSKFNTFCQILLVLLVFLHLAHQVPSQSILNQLLWLVVITTIGSGVHYGWFWGRKFASEYRVLKAQIRSNSQVRSDSNDG